jgi:hypothetical protein
MCSTLPSWNITGKLLESPGDVKNLPSPTRPRERSSESSRVLPKAAPLGSAWNTWYFDRVTHQRKPLGNLGRIFKEEMTPWKLWLESFSANIQGLSETNGYSWNRLEASRTSGECGHAYRPWYASLRKEVPDAGVIDFYECWV